MINELLMKRHSTRAFSNEAIKLEIVEELFEAARWAPSSANLQPWTFYYAVSDDRESFEKVVEVLNHGNALWAKDAPLLIIPVAKMTWDDGTPNKHAFHDVGLATANLTVQATHMGMYVHIMGGFSSDRVRDLLQLPEGYEPVTVIAVGYKGDLSKLPENLQKRELAARKRKELDEIMRKIR